MSHHTRTARFADAIGADVSELPALLDMLGVPTLPAPAGGGCIEHAEDDFALDSWTLDDYADLTRGV